MTGAIKEHCSFCRQAAAIKRDSAGAYIIVDCDNCGKYSVSNKANSHIGQALQDNNNVGLANCAAAIIAANEENSFPRWQVEMPSHNSNPRDPADKFLLIQDFLSAPVDHSRKADDLLLRMGTLVSRSGPFSPVPMQMKHTLAVKIADEDEYQQILEFLTDSQLLTCPSSSIGRSYWDVPVCITAQGWNRISELGRTVDSNSVFIAMQFNWPDDAEGPNELKGAIKNACKAAGGFDATTVDQPHHIDKISDRIIAEINRAKFVVADFTYNNRGVYFESGYARGLGIPVIHTIKSGFTKHTTDTNRKLHFDIQDINYIEWDTTIELETKLIDRINAVINKR